MALGDKKSRKNSRTFARDFGINKSERPMVHRTCPVTHLEPSGAVLEQKMSIGVILEVVSNIFDIFQ